MGLDWSESVTIDATEIEKCQKLELKDLKDPGLKLILHLDLEIEVHSQPGSDWDQYHHPARPSRTKRLVLHTQGGFILNETGLSVKVAGLAG